MDLKKIGKTEQINITYHGKKMLQMRFRSEKGIKVDQIQNYLQNYKEFTDMNKTAQKNHNGGLEFLVTSYLPQGVRSSKFHSLNNIEVLDDRLKDSWEDWEEATLKDVLVYVKASNKPVGGSDKHNDCLYLAILKAFGNNKEKLPSVIDKAYKLKTKIFDLERDDKVPVKKLCILEDRFNWSFSVHGDVEYISKEIKPVHINLYLHNEHYTLRCNENREKTNFVFHKERTKSQVYSMKYEKDKRFIYDGKEIIEMSQDDFMKLRNDCILIKCKEDEDIKKVRNDYIKKADLLKLKTDGTINLYKYQTISVGALELWRMMSKTFQMCEDIDTDEAIFIDRANHGGHHYNEK